MAKKKTKKKTKTNAKARTTGLVGTQRAVLEALKTKRDLAKLAAKLAAKHGTPEQQALKASEIEALKRDEIEALVAEMAVRAHERKRVHLSEMGGWPVCWADEKREGVKPLELLATPIEVKADAVTCTRCKKAAEIPTAEEAAALEQAEVEAEKSRKTKRGKGTVKKKAGDSARAKRQLKLKKNLTVRLKIKGLEVRGVVRPDGSMSVKSKSYDSPHAAANELAGDLVNYRIDGFQAWRFQDGDGKWRMLRDHA